MHSHRLSVIIHVPFLSLLWLWPCRNKAMLIVETDVLMYDWLRSNVYRSINQLWSKQQHAATGGQSGNADLEEVVQALPCWFGGMRNVFASLTRVQPFEGDTAEEQQHWLYVFLVSRQTLADWHVGLIAQRDAWHCWEVGA